MFSFPIVAHIVLLAAARRTTGNINVRIILLCCFFLFLRPVATSTEKSAAFGQRVDRLEVALEVTTPKSALPGQRRRYHSGF